jgi:putative SOS response-associated peptidase YedK
MISRIEKKDQMCYNIAYMQRRAEKIAKRYGAEIPAGLELPVYYHVNGFAHPRLPVLTTEKPKQIQLYQWGLIPSWCKDEGQAAQMQKQTLNAVSETVFEKPSFRSSILTQRCLLLVDGFYEWHTVKKPGIKKEEKYPHFIRLRSQETFALGGIYNNWVNRQTGEVHHTFSILTTPANTLLEKIHNTKKRMPFIPMPGQELEWLRTGLSKDEIKAMMKPLEPELMEAHTISKLITSRTENSNVPAVMEKFEYEDWKLNNEINPPA